MDAATLERPVSPRAFTVPAVRRGPWLLLIVVLATALRVVELNAPLQQDEFGPLYAVAQRTPETPGVAPAESSPLVPVPLGEVAAHSVLPYGIEQPLPFYHYLLALLVRVLPISAWALRLPSVVAGVLTIVALYAVCRRLVTEQAALAVALLAAVEPMQLALSDMARPYALANLACVLSFWFLLGVLQARLPGRALLAAFGYGLMLAVIGYLNSVLLLVVAAQLVFGVAWQTGQGIATSRLPGAVIALALAAGLLLTAILLVPLLDYTQTVGRFYQAHHDYLRLFGPPRLVFFVFHHCGLLFAFLATLAVAGFAWIKRQQGKLAVGPAEAGSDGRALVWLGGCWLLVPQLAAVAVFFVNGQAVCLSRYLSYTLLGGVVLVAAVLLRERVTSVRWLGVLVVAGVLYGWGLTPWCRGGAAIFLKTDVVLGQRLGTIARLEEQGKWREGDVVLVRSGMLEGDFLQTFPEESRRHVEGIDAAPLLVFSAGRSAKPFVVLSLTQGSTSLAKQYEAAAFYTPELGQRLKPYRRFWVVGHEWDRPQFEADLAQWLANQLQTPLRRSEPDGLTLLER